MSSTDILGIICTLRFDSISTLTKTFWLSILIIYNNYLNINIPFSTWCTTLIYRSLFWPGVKVTKVFSSLFVVRSLNFVDWILSKATIMAIISANRSAPISAKYSRFFAFGWFRFLQLHFIIMIPLYVNGGYFSMHFCLVLPGHFWWMPDRFLLEQNLARSILFHFGAFWLLFISILHLISFLRLIF